MAKILYLLVFVMSTQLNVFKSQKKAALNYIEKYKELAIIEMQRTGIPASITLAQALHESNNGNSDLAVIANNHFGIKCKSYWQGSKYYHKDDDFNKKGELIDSCFRQYDQDTDSYVDHSNFLQYSGNYTSLFFLDPLDFRAWAKGLQSSGYATDPAYATKLIKKIEKFKLYEYDTPRAVRVK